MRSTRIAGRHALMNSTQLAGRQDVRRIAIFRALQLGDMLVAVPALRSIRAGFPYAEITLIGLPWAAQFAQRFARYIDRFVEFAGFPGIVEAEVAPERTARFLKGQRAYSYDLVIQMHGSGPASNLFAQALGGSMTAGYFAGTMPEKLTFGEPYPHDKPEVLRNLRLARMLGCPDSGERLEFPLFGEDLAEAAALLRLLPRADRPWIGMHGGARPSARRWPVEYFAHVGDELARRYSAQLLLTGGADERETIHKVIGQMETTAINLAGATSRGGLAALISHLDLFISNDTGPAHIACAVDTPSITIFGPADPRRWAPLDTQRHPIVRHPVACSPCGYQDCPIDHRCLRRLRPEVVIETAEKLLAKEGGTCNASKS